MNVVLACKPMRIDFFVYWAFNLNNGVINAKLSPTKVCHLTKRLQRVVRYYMHGQSILTDRDGPNM